MEALFEESPELILSFFKLEQKRECKYTIPRMSSLSKSCLRELILGHRHNLTYKSYIGGNQSLIFDIGDNVHSVVQNDPKYFVEKIYGKWKCLACGDSIGPIVPRPPHCTSCGAHKEALQYEELFLCIRWLTAHPDAYISFPDAPENTVRVGEFKSIQKEDYKTLTAPLAEHVYQLNGYMFLSGIISKKCSWPVTVDTSKGYIYYFSKGHAGKQYPIKIFTIRRNDTIVKDIASKITEYRECYDPKKRKISRLPEVLTECRASDWGAYRPKSCPAKELCRKACQ